MNKIVLFFVLLTFSCDTGNLTLIADLPNDLYEASGIETSTNTNLWMLNDGGNKPQLFSVDTKGKIQHILKVNAKNHDWEDLTQDKEGNIYIGDFGNNANKRKNLAILKISKDSLMSNNRIAVERISFKYENQEKFPPKKKQLYFDCESFFYFNDSLYLFTKSRVKNDFGKTNLYKIPAKGGHHIAKLVDSFTTCNELPCWVTSADISNDGKTIALLSLNSVWTFKNFKDDRFFSGDVNKYDLGFESQKESVCFKNSNTLYITDELVVTQGGNLYELNLITKDN